MQQSSWAAWAAVQAGPQRFGRHPRRHSLEEGAIDSGDHTKRSRRAGHDVSHQMAREANRAARPAAGCAPRRLHRAPIIVAVTGLVAAALTLGQTVRPCPSPPRWPRQSLARWHPCGRSTQAPLTPPALSRCAGTALSPPSAPVGLGAGLGVRPINSARWSALAFARIGASDTPVAPATLPLRRHHRPLT